MTAPLALALDGSTRVCSVALLRTAELARAVTVRSSDSDWESAGEWEPAGESTEVDERSQAKVLLRMVDDLLRDAGRQPSDLRAIVTGVGPGTFTGVRIAVATARALALALGIPIVGISTLSALASQGALELGRYQSTEPEGRVRLLVPVVDARRSQLFYGWYERVGEESGGAMWRRSAPFDVCDRGALGELLAGRASEAAVVGEAADLVLPLPKGVVFIQSEVRATRLVIGQNRLEEPGGGPEGRRLLRWLNEASAQKVASFPEGVKPIYVRSPDADIHITKMRDPWGGLPASRQGPSGR